MGSPTVTISCGAFAPDSRLSNYALSVLVERMPRVSERAGGDGGRDRDLDPGVAGDRADRRDGRCPRSWAGWCSWSWSRTRSCCRPARRCPRSRLELSLTSATWMRRRALCTGPESAGQVEAQQRLPHRRRVRLHPHCGAEVAAGRACVDVGVRDRAVAWSSRSVGGRSSWSSSWSSSTSSWSTSSWSEDDELVVLEELGWWSSTSSTSGRHS